jgi:hypothetical protein
MHEPIDIKKTIWPKISILSEPLLTILLVTGTNEDHFQDNVTSSTVQNTNYCKRTANGCIKIFTGLRYMTSLKGHVVGKNNTVIII